jgi:hypothetical protein
VTLVITTDPVLPPGEVGVPYSVTLAASGGTSPLTWKVTSGAVPEGLVLNPASGTVSGTPQRHIFTTALIKVIDSSTPRPQSAWAYVIFNIARALAIQTSALPQAKAGSPYRAVLQATGGRGALSWSIAAGSLPQGLALDATGAVTGTPGTATTGTTARFTAQARDALAGLAQSELSITVQAAPSSWTMLPFTADLARNLTNISLGLLPDQLVLLQVAPGLPVAWTSPDGASWTPFSGQNPSVLLTATGVTSRGRVWLVGAGSYDSNCYVYSFDGTSWMQVAVTPQGPLARNAFSAVGAFGDYLCAVGGMPLGQDNQPTNQVYTWSGGSTWTRRATPPWKPRIYPGIAEFNARLWVCGGIQSLSGAPVPLNDIWSTADGDTWAPGSRVPWDQDECALELAGTRTRLYAITARGDPRTGPTELGMWFMNLNGVWNNMRIPTPLGQINYLSFGAIPDLDTDGLLIASIAGSHGNRGGVARYNP